MSTRLASLLLNRRSVVASLLAVPVATTFGVRLAGAQSQLTVTMVTDTAGLGDQNFNDLRQTRARQGGGRSRRQDRRHRKPRPGRLRAESDASGRIERSDHRRRLFADRRHHRRRRSIRGQEVLADRLGVGRAERRLRRLQRAGRRVSGRRRRRQDDENQQARRRRRPKDSAGRPLRRRFEAGAKSVNPQVDVIVAYANTFDDPALGKELSFAQYNQGADIVFPAAGKTGSARSTRPRRRGKASG